MEVEVGFELRDETGDGEHIALTKGDLSAPGPVLVRMHALDPLLDVVGLGPAGRRNEFGDAMRLIAADSRRVMISWRIVQSSVR